jgi:hypothetical protein
VSGSSYLISLRKFLASNNAIKDRSWKRRESNPTGSQRGDIVDQIESLLAKLTSDLTVWRSLTDGFDVDLFCGLFLGNHQPRY